MECGRSCVLLSSCVHLVSGAVSGPLAEHSARIGKFIIKLLCTNPGHWFHRPLNKCPQACFVLCSTSVLSGFPHFLICLPNFLLQLFRSCFDLGFGVGFFLCCVVVVLICWVGFFPDHH